MSKKLELSKNEMQKKAKQIEENGVMVSKIDYLKSNKVFKLINLKKYDYLITYENNDCIGIIKIE